MLLGTTPLNGLLTMITYLLNCLDKIVVANELLNIKCSCYIVVRVKIFNKSFILLEFHRNSLLIQIIHRFKRYRFL